MALALTRVRPSSRAGLAGTVRSEFTKVRSTRSTYWALALLVLVSLAWSVIFCAGTAAHWAHMSAQDRSALDPVASSVLGVALLGQLVIVVLGVLAITTEYSSQAIRTSLAVMPRRGVLFGAKAIVLAAVGAVVAFPVSFAAFFLGQFLLRSTHAGATLAQPGAARAVLAAAVYLVLCGLFSYALGTLLRSTAGAVTVAYGLLFLLPELARALPADWYQDVLRWLPGGGQFVAVITSKSSQAFNGHFFSAWVELAIFAGYTAGLLVAAVLTLRRRDA
jgi:ABC-2 type transport system permease protein